MTFWKDLNENFILQSGDFMQHIKLYGDFVIKPSDIIIGIN